LVGARVSLGQWIGLTGEREVKRSYTDAEGRYFLEHACSAVRTIVDPARDPVDFIGAYAEGYWAKKFDRSFSEPKLLCTSELQTLHFFLRPHP
jgi:hypothetical protein